jgi:hypothetical protein
MAATTPPASFQKSYIKPSTTSYDEFGAHSVPTIAPTVTSWDEQVVPALRKKLEEESIRLDQRIGQLDQQQYQGRQQNKSVRRLDRAHEVLQDGLGSDDLIPSGWATGSSAQFAAIAPRSKAQAEDRLRSVSAHQPYTSHDYSPPAQLESPPSAYFRHTPSPTSAGGSSHSIVQAREKARRLAREREVMGYTQQLSPSALQGNFSNEWLEQAQAGDEARQEGDERDNQRARTVSSPALQKQQLSGSLPRSNSKGNLREDATSRNPIPASKSMPRSHKQDAATHDVRKTKSTTRLDTIQTPPPQRDSPQNASRARAAPLRTLQNNTSPGHSQNVLDEFGPLGGTPTPTKRGRRPGETDEEEAWRTAQRSVSNPWDEEMIPTVKKRLEQQKMLEDLSRDEDFVDTWDRNGLPLSKRQVSLRQRASEGRNNAITPTPSPRKKEERSVDEGSEKMRRLHEQLNLGGLGGQQSSISSVGQQEEHLREQRRCVDLHEGQQLEHIDMQKKLDREKQQQQQRQPQHQQRSHREQAGFDSHNGQESAAEPWPTPSPSASKEQAGPRLAEVDAAGCCKCTVM